MSILELKEGMDGGKVRSCTKLRQLDLLTGRRFLVKEPAKG